MTDIPYISNTYLLIYTLEALENYSTFFLHTHIHTIFLYSFEFHNKTDTNNDTSDLESG